MRAWIFISCIFAVGIFADETKREIHVQGHRGNAALHMENTLRSFEEAIKSGADSIELDVNVSKDGKLVVFHDFEFSPQNTLGPDGKPINAMLPIHSLDYADIRNLEVKDMRHLQVPDTLTRDERRAPLLEEVFELVRNMKHRNARRVVIDIEVKSDPRKAHLSPPPDEFAKLVMDSIKKSGLEKQIAVRSFDHRILFEARKRDPHIPITALVYPNFPRVPYGQMSTILRPNVIAPKLTMLTPFFVDYMHRQGIKVMPFTANSPEEWERLLQLGVDGMTGDDPAAIRRYIRSRGYRDATEPKAIYFGCPFTQIVKKGF